MSKNTTRKAKVDQTFYMSDGTIETHRLLPSMTDERGIYEVALPLYFADGTSQPRIIKVKRIPDIDNSWADVKIDARPPRYGDKFVALDTGDEYIITEKVKKPLESGMRSGVYIVDTEIGVKVVQRYCPGLNIWMPAQAEAAA